MEGMDETLGPVEGASDFLDLKPHYFNKLLLSNW